jgi:hypothetical protein
MTTVTASPQHHLPAGKACFRRRIAVVPVLSNAYCTPPSMPKSSRRLQPRRQNSDRDRRSATEYAGQRYPRRGR